MPRLIPRRAGLSFVLLTVTGCHSMPPATPPPATPPPATPPLAAGSQPAATEPAVALPQAFDDATDGIRFTYPGGWTVQPSPADPTRLRAVAPPGAVHGGSATLSLDVPQLPAHIPGFLPIGLIAGGYVDDVRKRLPDATGTPTEIRVPNATGRRVTLTGHDAAGHATTDDAVLLVHADRVYILTVDADPAARPAATAALDAAVASLRWTR